MQPNISFTKKLSIRLTSEQFEQMQQWQKKWCMQSLSQVVRKLVAGEEINVKNGER